MMASPFDLRALGQLIRARRVAAGLTQAALGKKAGIVGKYVSEIERGNRDVPFSTLRAVVEEGLGLVLEIRFEKRGNGRGPSLPPELREIADLPPEARKAALAVIRAVLPLVRR